MNATTSDKIRSGGISGWNVALGVWVLISPFVMGYRQNTNFLWNNVIIGIAIALIALLRNMATGPRAVYSWLNVVLGIWLIISPFALRFTGNALALWNNIIVGIIVTAIAASNVPSSEHVVLPSEAR